jgi:hypothetical protein
MLAAAFGNWVSQLTERGFDESFISLLRAHGFYDIHFRHGQFEFGKDFVAKRDEDGHKVQYGFQSKAGDINGSAWDAIYSQLEELTSGQNVPVGFDKTLPRCSVLVTTGRLKGKASLSAKTFETRVKDRGDGRFEVWEQDTLMEMVEGSGRFPVAPSPTLTALLAHIEGPDCGERSLEAQLAVLVDAAKASTASLHRALVDNAICAATLAEKGRGIQQLAVALNAVRIAATLAHSDAGEAKPLLHMAFDSYVAQGERCYKTLLAAPGDEKHWLKAIPSSTGQMVIYPVHCLKVLEFAGLASLWCAEQGNGAGGQRWADVCAQIVDGQRGAFHPVSDRYAASLAPVVLALRRFGKADRAERLLRETAKWVFDRYDGDESGLAGPYSTPTEETRTLLGSAFEAISLARRRESLLGVALADLTYCLASGLYPDIVNDMKAVGIVPTAIHALDLADAYVVAKQGATRGLVNIAYPEAVGATRLRHHQLQEGARAPETIGGVVVMLALACVARDRLFSDCYARAASGLETR